MPLSVADLAMVGDAPITIRSTAFTNVYLRMDGNGVSSTGPGGTVNCQFSAGSPGPYERYLVRTQADGSVSFESAAFPNVFLRMVGTGVTSSTDAGGGTVNCQFNANGGVHEKFVLTMADQDINFVIQRQEQDMWCWDAASVSVAKFYDANSAWTQGTLAGEELNRNDCVVRPGEVSPCNQGRWPDTALVRIGHWDGNRAGALTSAELGAWLARRAPVVVNIDWPDPAGGHIVVLHGRSVRDGVEWVKVADPWEGNSQILMRYDDFRNRYPDRGTWTVSYKTQP